MTHPSVEDVALHLEGVLDPAEEVRVRTHLEQCADCAATAEGLRAVTAHLQSAAMPPGSSDSSGSSGSPESTTVIPADVAARVESAIAQEAAERAGAGNAATAGTAASGRALGDLAERRRRRRRVLSGGLLAAAAATVVAVGLGELTQTGGAGRAADGSAGSVAVEQDSGPSAQRPDALSARPPGAAVAGGGAHDQGGPKSGAEGFQNRLTQLDAARLRDAVIEGVAAAHSPGRARHDLPGCVRSALGDDLGPVASYAVRVPGTAGGPGVVVLRPGRAPTEGILVGCTPQPHVLARRGLHP